MKDLKCCGNCKHYGYAESNGVCLLKWNDDEFDWFSTLVNGFEVCKKWTFRGDNE